jgi:hypothetical protein
VEAADRRSRTARGKQKGLVHPAGGEGVEEMTTEECVRESEISWFAYDRATQTLSVSLEGGDAYFYSDVPWEVFQSLCEPKGRDYFFRHDVMGKYKRDGIIT